MRLQTAIQRRRGHLHLSPERSLVLHRQVHVDLTVSYEAPRRAETSSSTTFGLPNTRRASNIDLRIKTPGCKLFLSPPTPQAIAGDRECCAPASTMRNAICRARLLQSHSRT